MTKYLEIKEYYKTADLLKVLGVSRMTLYNWERRGVFTPPRNIRGDRVFTKEQIGEIATAFAPGGNYQWHFGCEPSR